MKLRLCVIKKDITVLCDLYKGHIMLLCITNDININHLKCLLRFSTLLSIAQMEHKLSIFYDVEIISFFLLFMFSVFHLLIRLHLLQDLKIFS